MSHFPMLSDSYSRSKQNPPSLVNPSQLLEFTAVLDLNWVGFAGTTKWHLAYASWMAIYPFLHEFSLSLDYKLIKEGTMFDHHPCSVVSDDNGGVEVTLTQHPLFQIRLTEVSSPKPQTQPFIPHSQQMSSIPLFLKRQRWHKLSSHNFLPLCSVSFLFLPCIFRRIAPHWQSW